MTSLKHLHIHEAIGMHRGDWQRSVNAILLTDDPLWCSWDRWRILLHLALTWSMFTSLSSYFWISVDGLICPVHAYTNVCCTWAALSVVRNWVQFSTSYQKAHGWVLTLKIHIRYLFLGTGHTQYHFMDYQYFNLLLVIFVLVPPKILGFACIIFAWWIDHPCRSTLSACGSS